MLETKKLGYWYGHEDDALFKNVTLSFDAGMSYAIVGQSGSGKTTFLALISGLDIPKAGVVEFKGQDISTVGLTKYRRHDVAIVFQSYNLFSYMSALENLMVAMAITGAQHKGDKEFARQVLAKLGLTDEQMVMNVQKLSGGQQQRVAIARTMCCDAPLVVADEPTGNLDERNTVEVIDLLQQIAHEQHKCVIIVTHEVEVAARCDVTIRLAERTFRVEQPA